jgi:hypothetical protein
MKWTRSGAGGLVALLCCSVAGAQQPAQPSPQTPPAEEVAAAPKRVEVGAELRWRWEARDNADFQTADDFDQFLGHRLRLQLLVRLSPALDLFVMPQDVWLVNAASDKVVHDLNTNLYQAYFEWKPGGGERAELRAGRQALAYGGERLVGAFGWDNVGRSFDGARLRVHATGWQHDFLWVRQVEVRRGGRPAREGHQDLSGVYLRRGWNRGADGLEIYGLFLRDGLRTGGELGGAPQPARIFTAGLRRVHQPAAGWRYSVEHAGQVGARGPDPHRAAMAVVTGGYAWAGRWRPRVGGEYAFATGDGAPTDGRSREFHNLFPTNHLYYGYADLVGLRNLHNLRGTAAAAMHPKVTLELDYHRFWLASARGAWKNAGGRVLGFDPSGASGRDLGQELDLTLRWAAHKHFGLMAGYSMFFPGRFARATRGPETHRFGFVQTVLRF